MRGKNMRRPRGSIDKTNINTLKRSLMYGSTSGLENESDSIALQDLGDSTPCRTNKKVVFCSSPSYISGGGGDETDMSVFNEIQFPLEEQAVKIINVLEQDNDLMANNPSSEQKRLDTLREMTESLTLKRKIRKKLVNRVAQKSRGSPLSLYKRMKYQLSISFTKSNILMQEMLYSFELWYSSIKMIEGYYGSAVATFFRFFRWLFLMNCFVCIVSLSFVVIPQMLYDYLGPRECKNFDSDAANQSNSAFYHLTNSSLQSNDGNKTYINCRHFNFAISNIFTGEGYFSNTSLYYGHYTNESWEAVPGMYYSIPSAYFFTILFCYLFTFISLSVRMAQSYRKSFIETSRGIKNIYAHKIFCGWDFTIASEDSAQLKSNSIFHELKELLNEENKSDISETWKEKFHIFGVRFTAHLFTGIISICTGSIMWLLLSFGSNDNVEDKYQHSFLTSIIVSVIMIMSPVLFTWIVRFEEYKSPRTVLYVTLVRTYLLGMIVVGVLIAFWLKKSEGEENECWETSLGQEVYRLILMDFIIAILGTACAEFVRKLVHMSLWKKIGQPEFNIVRNTLNLIYNETLLFVGFFFCPPLSVVIILKMFITFYIKKFGALKNCQPPINTWRAAQTHTLFLVLSFLSLLCVIIVHGYILTFVKASDCGPFQGYPTMYQMIIEKIFQLEENHKLFKAFVCITKPGVIAGVLIGMCVLAYYLRAQSRAQMNMVDKLQNILFLEAKDKEFLLHNISKLTDKNVLGHKLPIKVRCHRRISIPDENLSNRSSSSSLGGQKVADWLLNFSGNASDIGGTSNDCQN